MKAVVGVLMIIAGLYFFWPVIAFGPILGALLIGAGALAVRSKVTGKPMLGGSSQRFLGD